MTRHASHYVHTGRSNIILIRLTDIDENIRDINTPIYRSQKDYELLKHRILNDLPLDPVVVYSIKKSGGCKHKLRDGCHRYHLSKELGFALIPAVIDDYELDDFFATESKTNEIGQNYQSTNHISST